MNIKRTAMIGGLLFSSVLGGVMVATTPTYAADNIAMATDDASDWVPDAALRQALQSALGAGVPLTKSNVAQIQQLNLTYDGITDLTGLEYATNLSIIDLTGNAISDISALANLPKLQDVSLRMNKATVLPDLTPLTSTPIKSLNLVADDYGLVPEKLAALNQMTALTSLEMQNTKVTSVPELGNLHQLRELGLAGNKLTDVSALAPLTQLTSLKVGSNQITDFTPIAKLTNLTTLSIGNNRSNDISMLSTLTKLQQGTFSQMGLTDAMMPTFAAMPDLTDLSIDFNDQITSLTALQQLTKLTSLNFSKDQVADLTPLQHLTSLTSLNFSNAQVTTLQPIAGLTNLTYVNLLRNHVRDLTPLAKMTGLTYVNAKQQSITLPAAAVSAGQTDVTVPVTAKAIDGTSVAITPQADTNATVTDDQVTFTGVTAGTTGYLAWDNAAATGNSQRFSGTITQSFEQAVETTTPESQRIAVKLAVLKGDGSQLTSVASNYVQPDATFEADGTGGGYLYVNVSVPSTYGDDSVTFKDGERLSTKTVGVATLMTTKFHLTPAQVANPYFMENMHVNIASIGYNHRYDVAFKVTGIPDSQPTVTLPGSVAASSQAPQSSQASSQSPSMSQASSHTKSSQALTSEQAQPSQRFSSQASHIHQSSSMTTQTRTKHSVATQKVASSAERPTLAGKQGIPLVAASQAMSASAVIDTTPASMQTLPSVVASQTVASNSGATSAPSLVDSQAVSAVAAPSRTQPTQIVATVPTSAAVQPVQSGQAVPTASQTASVVDQATDHATTRQPAQATTRTRAVSQPATAAKTWSTLDTIASVVGGLAGLGIAWGFLVWFKIL
ncbi:leucine-rich repeat domain-containing protein [Weissella cibaria]|uniref:Leucine-rich repeat domain-containing protein n=1 Tax=Weissella cibaria TaxID=137591 RepID=A0A9Q8JJ26_9LACO|nr:leucine-rich repeat domain-containing protein [Weissella cibaria]TVV28110.1 hypothetical protein FO435_09590 [Weissella cibaria]TVV41303.1 hypothetical protein FO438_09420 [Weissella cibaria]